MRLPRVLTDRTAFLLQVAVGRAQAMGEDALAGLGITGREYGVLALLSAMPAAASGQGRVGAALGLDRTTTMKVLAALRARGLVARTADPRDRRTHVTTLTDRGGRLHAAAAEVLADCEDRFLGPLTPAERDQLRGLLTALTGSAD